MYTPEENLLDDIFNTLDELKKRPLWYQRDEVLKLLNEFSKDQSESIRSEYEKQIEDVESLEDRIAELECDLSDAEARASDLEYDSDKFKQGPSLKQMLERLTRFEKVKIYSSDDMGLGVKFILEENIEDISLIKMGNIFYNTEEIFVTDISFEYDKPILYIDTY